MKSPTQNSKKLLKSEGWECEVTERWNPFAKIRQDLFNFCDILCLRGKTIMAVQTTSLGHTSARIKKIMEEPLAQKFMDAGGLIRVHGWAKMGPRGKRKKITCKVFAIPPQAEPLRIVTL